jgi:hypothetical protein
MVCERGRAAHRAGDRGGTNFVTVSEKTRNHITHSVQRSFERLVQMDATNRQIIKGVRILAPCGEVAITQESLLKMWAKDIANGAVDVAMQSDEIQNYIRTLPRPVGAAGDGDGGAGGAGASTTDNLILNVRIVLMSVLDQLGPLGTTLVLGGLVLALIIVPRMKT